MACLKFKTIAILALLTGSLAAAVPDPAVAIIPTPPPAKDTHCPTVTSTGTVCSTCAVPKCLAWSTISNPCDCARTVPTVTVDFPCHSDGKHCGAGCLTMYKSATSTSTCNDVPIPTPPSPKTTVTTTETAASCTTTVTANIYETAKCTKGCVSDFCIVDSLVTLPCGCSRLSIVTSTVTLPCPKSTQCTQCFTAWPFTTDGPCPTTAPSLGRA